MTQRDDGGPAFPTDEGTYDFQGRRDAGRLGMSMRDYFAGQFLAGVLSDIHQSGLSDQKFAEWAYSLADAMLEARQK